MYVTIQEPIEVAGVYHHHSFTPKKFKWRHKIYPIDKITLKSDVKSGGVRFRYYSVMSRSQVFRVTFNRDDESWILEELWTE